MNVIFGPSTPDGAAFTEWDPTTRQFLPVSRYDTNSGWSINYTLSYGQGGLLHTAAAFTNTFVGTVWPGFSLGGPFVPPLVTGSGLLLLSCYVPIAPATFYDVVGRAPQNGESVSILNALTQITTLTAFDNGVWSNGDPLLNIGQSAVFNLVPTPEPGSLSLMGVGVVLLAAGWRKQVE